MTESTVSLMHTEVSHTVVVELPESLPAIPMGKGWKFRPATATLTYTLDTAHANPELWQSRAEIIGPWLPKEGVTPKRPGAAFMLSGYGPDWLEELMLAHVPTWLPNLPDPVLPSRNDKGNQES